VALHHLRTLGGEAFFALLPLNGKHLMSVKPRHDQDNLSVQQLRCNQALYHIYDGMQAIPAMIFSDFRFFLFFRRNTSFKLRSGAAHSPPFAAGAYSAMGTSAV
jgi:hypothetical protein